MRLREAKSKTRMEFNWSEKIRSGFESHKNQLFFVVRIDLKWVRHLPNIKSKSMFAKKNGGKLFRRLIFTLIQLLCPALVFREFDLYTCLCFLNWLPHVHFGLILSEKNWISSRTPNPTNRIPFWFVFFLPLVSKAFKSYSGGTVVVWEETSISDQDFLKISLQILVKPSWLHF